MKKSSSTQDSYLDSRFSKCKIDCVKNFDTFTLFVSPSDIKCCVREFHTVQIVLLNIWGNPQKDLNILTRRQITLSTGDYICERFQSVYAFQIEHLRHSGEEYCQTSAALN